MAPSGSSGYVPLVLLPLLLVTIITSASSSSAPEETYPKSLGRIFGRDSYSNITNSDLIDIITEQNCSPSGTAVYSREFFSLMVAITRHDLHRFANYSCDVECAARWIQLGAEIYDRDVNCSTTHEYNCSHYAHPVKETDLVHLVQLDQHYSNYSDYDNQSADYGQLVATWAKAMQLVEQYRPRGAVFCYKIPTEFAKSRREEFYSTVMHSLTQTLGAGWYFESFTLAPFLDRFCGPKAMAHSNQYAFHYFVWSLTNAFPFATNESIHSYVSLICPVYGAQFPLHLATDLHEVITDSYLNTAMILPRIMLSYLSRVMAHIRAHQNKDKYQMVIVLRDALEWMKQDFAMVNGLSKGNNNNHYDSLDRVIIRKIVFYLLVPHMAEQLHKQELKKNEHHVIFAFGLSRLHFGYIFLGCMCVLQLVLSLCIYRYFYPSSSADDKNKVPVPGKTTQ